LYIKPASGSIANDMTLQAVAPPPPQAMLLRPKPLQRQPWQ